MSDFVTVAQVGDIPEGEGRAFPVGDQMVAVFNEGDRYHAIDDMCPHMGASLASGHYENCVVTCPWQTRFKSPSSHRMMGNQPKRVMLIS